MESDPRQSRRQGVKYERDAASEKMKKMKKMRKECARKAESFFFLSEIF